MSDTLPDAEPIREASEIRFPDFRYHFASNGLILARPDSCSEVYVYLPSIVVGRDESLRAADVTEVEIRFALVESGLLK